MFYKYYFSCRLPNTLVLNGITCVPLPAMKENHENKTASVGDNLAKAGNTGTAIYLEASSKGAENESFAGIIR